MLMGNCGQGLDVSHSLGGEHRVMILVRHDEMNTPEVCVNGSWVGEHIRADVLKDWQPGDEQVTVLQHHPLPSLTPFAQHCFGEFALIRSNK